MPKKTLDEVRQIVSDVSYQDRSGQLWRFRVGGDEEAAWVQCIFNAPDAANPGYVTQQRCRKWRISYWATETEIVTTCLKAVLTAEEHEARTFFTYKGWDLFNPHITVDAIIELLTSHGIEALDFREDFNEV